MHQPRLFLLVLAILFCASAGAQNINFANFNSGLPAGWTIQNGGTTTDTWYITPATGFNNQSLNGSAFAFVNSDAVPATPARTFSEQLKSPVFNGNAYGQVFLEFDHYYRDYSNDTGWVEVYNGTSWIALATFSANAGAWNAPVHQTYNLTPYRNANMQVRFRYEDRGIWAWYWAVDNVDLYAPSPWDVTLTALNPPTGACGLGNNEPVSVEVRNDGSAVITSLPLSYQVNGGAVITQTITTSIPPNGTFAHTFSVGANMATAGSYSFKAWTSLPSDADHSGDTIANVTAKNHVRVNTFPYVQDFENNNGSWFAVGTNSTWAWGTPNKTVIQGAASGTKAWTTGGLTGDYLDNEHSELEGPCFDLSSINGPWFGTDVWWNSEFSWDGANLQTSIDGGVTWANVGAFGDPYNWYTDDVINGAPGGSQTGWSGRNATNDGSGGYVRAVHSLANVSGNTDVILRIAFGTDASVIDDGIAFDKITIASEPILYLGPDTIACDSFRIQAGNWQDYEWSTQETTPSILVTQTGNYSLSVLDQYGFPSGDIIHVEIQGPGDWNLGQDTFFCTSNPYLLTGPVGAASYTWSTGDLTPQISTTTTGTYIVEATYPAGCVATDTVEVGFTGLEAILGLPDTLCKGSILQFANNSIGANTWWWDFGNGSFSSSSNPAAVYLSGGTFQIQLVVGDGQCSDTTVQWVFVDICTGNDNAIQPAIGVYPQPSNGWLTLHGEAWPAGSIQLKLVNLQGQVLIEAQTETQGNAWSLPLDLSGLPSGAYIMRASQGDAAVQIPVLLSK